MALADRSGGVVDHAFSEAQFRNFRVLQSAGWITTTLTEARNRADLIIVVGTAHATSCTRASSRRIVSPPDSMFEVTAAKRTVVFIGKGPKLAGGRRGGHA